MAGDGWRSPRGLIEQLSRGPQRFELLAAVALLEADGRRVRFRAPLRPVFPSGDVAAVRSEAPGEAVIETAAISLFGPNGPLPEPLAEALGECERQGGEGAAPRAFVEIFGDRLARLLVDALRLERPAAARALPEQNPQADVLLALAGRAYDRPGRSAIDRSLAGAAGLLDQRPQSLHACERLLAAHFGVPVAVTGLRGGWTALSEPTRARLGARPGAAGAAGGTRLGSGAAIGGRVWLQEVGIEIGPVSAELFSALLPGGTAHPRLRALVAAGLPPELDATCRLIVAAAEAPAARLGLRARLGWSTWLGGRPGAPDGTRADGVAEIRLDRDGGGSV